MFLLTGITNRLQVFFKVITLFDDLRSKSLEWVCTSDAYGLNKDDALLTCGIEKTTVKSQTGATPFFVCLKRLGLPLRPFIETCFWATFTGLISLSISKHGKEFGISFFFTFSAIGRLIRNYPVVSSGGNRSTRRKTTA